MSAYSRSKGNRAEVAVVNALKARGIEATTSRQANDGYQKGSDVLCDLPISIEVKNRKENRLGEWLDQAIVQAADGYGAVVHKRRGRADAGEWFVTMRFADFVALVRELETSPLPDSDVAF